MSDTNETKAEKNMYKGKKSQEPSVSDQEE